MKNIIATDRWLIACVRRLLCLTVVCSLVVPTNGQGTIPEFPANSGMVVAQAFCQEVDEYYSAALFTGQCLWFRFDVIGSDPISLNTNGSPASMVAAVDAEEMDCPLGTMGFSLTNALLPIGTYYIIFNWTTTGSSHVNIYNIEGIACPTLDGCDCLPTFNPQKKEEYIVSAWVLKEGAPLDVVNYGADIGSRPFVKISAAATPTALNVTYFPELQNPVIEGWQLIEGRFKMPTNASDFELELGVEDGTALFDDVRVFTADGSMKCYVYDQENLRFVAELDERHFATFYEYDNEGKLARVKKETERGVMTIQETRQNASHIEP